MTKLIIIAVISIVFLDLIKQFKSEYTSVLLLGICVVMLGIMLPEAKKLYLTFVDIFDVKIFPDKLFDDMMKICFVGYICKLVKNLCEDSGYKSISDKLELGCRVYVSGITISWIYRLLVDINKLL